LEELIVFCALLNHCHSFVPDDFACNSRNPLPGQSFNDAVGSDRIDLFDNVEIDYRGAEVTVENFLRVLTGRHDAGVVRSKRLGSNERSNVLIYLSGHGGDQFLKFQDREEITSYDIADAIHQMRLQRRYSELLFMTDTCQASTLHETFFSPGVVAIGSSRRGENSFSYKSDLELGVSVIDRFTFHVLAFFESQASFPSAASLHHLFSSFSERMLLSQAAWRDDLLLRSIEKIPVSQFFGLESHTAILHSAFPLEVKPLYDTTSVASPLPDTPAIPILHAVPQAGLNNILSACISIALWFAWLPAPFFVAETLGWSWKPGAYI